MVNLECRVFRVVRPVATVRFQVEPDPEPTREFGPVANTTHTVLCQHSSARWIPQRNILEWLHESSRIVWPNVGVCAQPYSQEDWQITET